MSDSKKRGREGEENEKISREEMAKLISLFKRETLVDIILNNVEISDSLYQSVLQKADLDDDCRNLFIRKVPFSATSEGLRALYEPFGTLLDCTVVTDKITKESKGYAFVKFQNAASAIRAVKAEMKMGDMELCACFACKNSKTNRTYSNVIPVRENILPASLPSAPTIGGDRKLYIRNIPFDANEDDLRDIFSQYGPIFDVAVCREHSGKSKGYAFLTFMTDEATVAALREPRKVLMNREISVNLASAGRERLEQRMMNRNSTMPDMSGMSMQSQMTPQQLYAMQMWGMNPSMQQMASYANPMMSATNSTQSGSQPMQQQMQQQLQQQMQQMQQMQTNPNAYSTAQYPKTY